MNPAPPVTRTRRPTTRSRSGLVLYCHDLVPRGVRSRLEGRSCCATRGWSRGRSCWLVGDEVVVEKERPWPWATEGGKQAVEGWPQQVEGEDRGPGQGDEA